MTEADHHRRQSGQAFHRAPGFGHVSCEGGERQAQSRHAQQGVPAEEDAAFRRPVSGMAGRVAGGQDSLKAAQRFRDDLTILDDTIDRCGRRNRPACRVA